MPDTLGHVRTEAREAARRSGVAPRDIDLLLGDLIGRDPIYVIANDDRVLTEDELSRFRETLERRLAGEPVQYIRGRCEFYGRTFHVDGRVLIPRPETEIICEEVLARALPGMRVIDVGCGSGAIAITMALECPGLRVFATERSLEAIVLARENARRLGARVEFAKGDLLSAFRGSFSLIASNPPYIPDEEIPGLQREVGQHEPHIALSGGPGGMNLIRRLVAEASELLEPGGTLVMEMGWNQGGRLTELGNDAGWDVEIIPDLSGTQRCGVFRKRA